jgi:hypothetical protein
MAFESRFKEKTLSSPWISLGRYTRIQPDDRLIC